VVAGIAEFTLLLISSSVQFFIVLCFGTTFATTNVQEIWKCKSQRRFLTRPNLRVLFSPIRTPRLTFSTQSYEKKMEINLYKLRDLLRTLIPLSRYLPLISTFSSLPLLTSSTCVYPTEGIIKLNVIYEY
jgi:hypothetical protein